MIYKYSLRFRVPAVDKSDCSIYYNYDLENLTAPHQRTTHTITYTIMSHWFVGQRK